MDEQASHSTDRGHEMSDMNVGIPNMMFTMLWQALLLAASIGLVVLAAWAAVS